MGSFDVKLLRKLSVIAPLRRVAPLAALVAALLPLAARAAPLTDADVVRIASGFGRQAVRVGDAVGMAIGVIYPGQPMRTFGFGLANAGSGTPVTPSSLFQVASIAKVFTTNLLGQAVLRQEVALSDPLARFSDRLGATPGLLGQVTLEQLATYTAGMAFQPPVCGSPAVAGCMPDAYPSQAEYAVADFMSYVRAAPLLNYWTSPPARLTALPAATAYSDVSVGLLGLLLGTPSGAIGTASIDGWYGRMQSRILAPLGMADTYAYVPASLPATRIASGYHAAAAKVTVSGGLVTAITMTATGQGYASVPQVRITGGNGAGATAVATLKNGGVPHIGVTKPGHGYIPPPVIAITPAGAKCTPSVTPVIAQGSVIGVSVVNGNCAYLGQAPSISISGGRLATGRDARLVAHVANTNLVAITVADGGAGYVDPLAVQIDPGGPNLNPVAAWAPSTSLSTSVNDLTRFAAAAAGLASVGPVAVPKAMTQAFALTQAQRVCVDSNPSLASCPPHRDRVGLAWQIHPADPAQSMPAVLIKPGGLQGFGSAMVLIPDAKIAAVVLVNGQQPNAAFRTASDLAYALFYGSP